MFKKLRLKHQIRTCKRAVTELESKRDLAHTAITMAIMKKNEPSDADVDRYNKYTALIEKSRKRLDDLTSELSNL